MRLLLDTHVAIWAVGRITRITPSAGDQIRDPSNEIWVSVASLWEIAIKYPLARKGEGEMPISASQALRQFENAGFRILEMSAAHALAVETLPLLHGDPFDRILVAQAQTEQMRLVTHDKVVAAYSDTILLF